MDSIDRLVEYHGFLPWHKQQLERHGVAEIFASHARLLNGLTTEERYIFETNENGFYTKNGEPTDDERGQLSDMVDNLSKRKVDNSAKGIPESVRNYLEGLGYT